MGLGPCLAFLSTAGIYSRDPSCLSLAQLVPARKVTETGVSLGKVSCPPRPLSSHAFLGGDGGKPSGVTPNRQVLCGAQWPEKCSSKVASPVALLIFARCDLKAAGTNPNCV